MRSARRACRGKRPQQVIKSFLAAARQRGAPPDLIRAAEHPPKRLVDQPGFAMLAGAVYARSLPAVERRDGAYGCAYELRRARELGASKNTSSIKGTSK
jgi:hypothetical protein